MSPTTPPPAGGDGALLRVEDLGVRFPTEDGVVEAVRGVSYELHPGEVLGVVGESGSGKSVSSLAVMGLLPKSARVRGRVLFRGRDVLAMSPSARRRMRGREVAMVFQDPMTAMNPVYTVGAQLAEAYRAHHAVGARAATERAAEVLDLVGIPRPRERLRAYPHEFSGGMRQRVMIAMAVINEPDVIIADEPTTALDVTVQAQVLEKLMEVKDAVGAAIVLITHDLGVVAGTAQRVLVMYAGRAVETGTVEQVFRTPRMPYTAGLLGSVPTPGHGGRLRPVPGTPPSLLHLPAGCPFSPRCPLAREDCRQREPELLATDHAGQLAACHHRDELALLARPSTVFSGTGADGPGSPTATGASA